MARSGDPDDGEEVWGTWEELLLACAVNRHGSRRWESVSMEIKSRSPASHLVTPQGCRQHFRDLQRRFGIGDDADDDDDSTDPDPPAEVPWLDELRKLRVAELRREVERYDVSIGSLQLKVKKLQEQRERSVRGEESDEGRPDDQEVKGEGKSPGSTPESLAGNRISSADASGPSCEQSNSTDPKQKPGDDGRKPEAPTAGAEAETAYPSSGGDEKVAERSYNGSTGSPAAAARSQATGESIAESNGGGEGEGEGEEGSDVQSSASLSRRRRRRQRTKTVPAGGEEEPEAELEDASIVNKGTAAESQPLVVILEMIRSDKFGSVFERRLESQEGVGYRSIVRQHVDLEMVRAKLDGLGSERAYASSEFFRDLLLLCTNAVVFYSKGSPESVAAIHLRRLVTKEMEAALGRLKEPTLPLSPSPPPQPEPTTTAKPKPEPDLAGALPDRPISSVPMIVCRKRSSISNKPAVAAVKEEKDEKPDPPRKDSDGEEKNPPKKTANERPMLSGTTRGLRTNKVRGGNGGGAAAKRSNLTPAPSLKSKAAEKAAAVEESPKSDKKNSISGAAATAASSTAKKQSATSFLNRMKRNSNGTLMEMLKNSSPTGGGSGRGKEQKKDAKADGRKGANSRQAAGGGIGSRKKTAAAAAETTGTSTKRSVGRPPKRAAVPPTPPPSKKAKEEGEAAPPPKTPASSSRKRGRR